VLIKHGADVNSVDAGGMTPLGMVLKNGLNCLGRTLFAFEELHNRLDHFIALGFLINPPNGYGLLDVCLAAFSNRGFPKWTENLIRNTFFFEDTMEFILKREKESGFIVQPPSTSSDDLAERCTRCKSLKLEPVEAAQRDRQKKLAIDFLDNYFVFRRPPIPEDQVQNILLLYNYTFIHIVGSFEIYPPIDLTAPKDWLSRRCALMYYEHLPYSMQETVLRNSLKKATPAQVPEIKAMRRRTLQLAYRSSILRCMPGRRLLCHIYDLPIPDSLQTFVLFGSCNDLEMCRPENS
jgi:hypothetical protein